MSEWKEIIYYIIVPIIAVIIPWFLQNLNERFKHDTQWKQSKEKSSLDIYFMIFVSIMILGFAWDVLIFYLSYSLYTFLNINIDFDIYNIIILIFCIIPYIILLILCQKNNRKVYLLRGLRFEKEIKKLLDMLTIIAVAVINIGLFLNKSKVLKLIVVILVVAVEILYFIFLDSKGKFKYNYAKFVFYDGSIVDNIFIKEISQKGKWIIARDEKCNVEFRFRIKDIEKVEYRKTLF